MSLTRPSLIGRFMGLTWDPSGADRTQVGPMLAPWTLLSAQGGYYSTPKVPAHWSVLLKVSSRNRHGKPVRWTMCFLDNNDAVYWWPLVCSDTNANFAVTYNLYLDVSLMGERIAHGRLPFLALSSSLWCICPRTITDWTSYHRPPLYQICMPNQVWSAEVFQA